MEKGLTKREIEKQASAVRRLVKAAGMPALSDDRLRAITSDRRRTELTKEFLRDQARVSRGTPRGTREGKENGSDGSDKPSHADA